ncbi:serine/threonine-protein kinase [Streptomyces sp. NPDC091371]|uniref:serine/threonine-protein kinase n=1 Tax=Streptomyces sp. NPDC091371 TaxID=3155303 RepID=UPI00343CFC91
MENVELSAPARVGPFRIVAVLGQGGMGRVLLGVAADGRLVAVKEVHAELAEDDGFRARFRREVEASRKVSGAYTAAVIDADPEAETPWLASEFVPGPSLQQAGALPEDAVRRLAAGLAQALADVHRAGLIHRDLKPSNVLLAEDGVRVIDFGIVRAVGDQTKITHTGALIGSPAFMSPEQVLGQELTPAADVFSLGATLVMACTGSAPFAAASVPRLLHEVVYAEPDLSAVPPALRGIIAPCLAKDPAARPSPQELLTMVGAVEPSARPWPEPVNALIVAQRARLAGLVATPEPPGAEGRVVKPGRRSRRRTRLLVAAGIVAVLVAAGLTFGRPVVEEVYYSAVPEDVPTPGTVPLTQVADKYAGPLPSTCADVEGKVAVPAGYEPSPGTSGIWKSPDAEGEHPSIFCVWRSRYGDEIYVAWDFFATKPGGSTGAQQAKRSYEGMYIRGRTIRDSALGFMEEGMWMRNRDRTPEEGCVLYARDVNLEFFFSLKGPNHPPGAACEAVLREIGPSAASPVAKR